MPLGVMFAMTYFGKNFLIVRHVEILKQLYKVMIEVDVQQLGLELGKKHFVMTTFDQKDLFQVGFLQKILFLKGTKMSTQQKYKSNF